ncbi:MAG: 4Fe-4S binding protein [Candidatus Omnitrophica bacterium]|nr:4Fe-4S binding protein [Candidatus Omnitrophota bacterium]
MKKLLIDLDLYTEYKDKDLGCSYFYHSDNKGVRSLLELATYAIVCRKCELEACVTSCPNEALEKRDDKILERYNMRCTSCKSCSHACPFGVIYTEMMTYLMPRCDLCLDKLMDGEEPACIKGSAEGVLMYGDFKEDEAKKIYAVSDNILVKAERWERNGVKSK